MRGIIICGHGNGDSGAISKIEGVTRKEANIVRSFGKKLYEKMKQLGCDVTLYDTNKNAYQELSKNSKSIIFKGYDYVIELHCNSSVNYDTNGDGKNKGTEIFVPSASGDKNNALAKDIVNAVASVGLTNRGVKVGKLLVINTAYRNGVKNAFLLELFFINDKDDFTIYKDNKTKIVNNIAKLFVTSSFLFKITSKTCPVYIDIENKVKSSVKLKKGEVFTIISTKIVSGVEFGELKSGAGYVNMNNGVKING